MFIRTVKCCRHIITESSIGETEEGIVVKNVKIVSSGLIGHIPSCVACDLIEYRKGIAHTTICLLSDDLQCLLLYMNIFLLSYIG